MGYKEDCVTSGGRLRITWKDVVDTDLRILLNKGMPDFLHIKWLNSTA